MSDHFWQSKPITELSHSEWESLCDGCGRCCVHKFQDEDTDELVYTNVACKLLDCSSSRCTNYEKRFSLVEGCIQITPDFLANEQQRSWLPQTCAYRLVSEGKPLHDWHPLLAGSTQKMLDAGIGLAGQLVSETEVDLEELENDL